MGLEPHLTPPVLHSKHFHICSADATQSSRGLRQACPTSAHRMHMLADAAGSADTAVVEQPAAAGGRGCVPLGLGCRRQKKTAPYRVPAEYSVRIRHPVSPTQTPKCVRADTLSLVSRVHCQSRTSNLLRSPDDRCSSASLLLPRGLPSLGPTPIGVPSERK